jgi:hypothetical protein
VLIEPGLFQTINRDHAELVESVANAAICLSAE